MVEFAKTTRAARRFPEFESTVRQGLGRTGLMLFMELDQGFVIGKVTGRDTARMVRLIIGNPVIMQQMARHVPDAGSYAPVTVLVDERSDGVHISYDKMTSLLAPYGSTQDAYSVCRARRAFCVPQQQPQAWATRSYRAPRSTPCGLWRSTHHRSRVQRRRRWSWKVREAVCPPPKPLMLRLTYLHRMHVLGPSKIKKRCLALRQLDSE